MTEKLILLVEDNDDDAELCVRALQKNNLANEIVRARDGQEALNFLHDESIAAERFGETYPELILLDLKLPKVDGLEVLNAIRNHARTKHLPVVVLTSSDLEDDIVACYDGGANGFVRKPINYLEFVEAVGNLGLFWLVINRTPQPGLSGP